MNEKTQDSTSAAEPSVAEQVQRRRRPICPGTHSPEWVEQSEGALTDAADGLNNALSVAHDPYLLAERLQDIEHAREMVRGATAALPGEGKPAAVEEYAREHWNWSDDHRRLLVGYEYSYRRITRYIGAAEREARQYARQWMRSYVQALIGIGAKEATIEDATTINLDAFTYDADDALTALDKLSLGELAEVFSRTHKLVAQVQTEKRTVAKLATEIRETTAGAALTYARFGAIEVDFNRVSLVDQVLDHGTLSVVYGESGSGKTFVVLDLAFSVATGRRWHDFETEQGAVCYVAAEGGSAIDKRIAALREEYPDHADVPMIVIRSPVDLSKEGADVPRLIDLLRQAEADISQPFKLIILDTLSRVLGGGNENSSEDMGALVKNFDALRLGVKSHLLIVHHCGKDRALGARGWSGLRAAVDTEIEINDKTVAFTKQRDLEQRPPFRFSLKPVQLGLDAKDRMVTSCIVTYSSVAASEADRERMLCDKVAAHMVVNEMVAELPVENIVDALMRHDQRQRGTRAWETDVADALPLDAPRAAMVDGKRVTLTRRKQGKARVVYLSSGDDAALAPSPESKAEVSATMTLPPLASVNPQSKRRKPRATTH